jgi:hypothetical protein
MGAAKAVVLIKTRLFMAVKYVFDIKKYYKGINFT